MVNIRIKDIEAEQLSDSDILVKDNNIKTSSVSYFDLKNDLTNSLLSKVGNRVGEIITGYQLDTTNLLPLDSDNTYLKADYQELWALLSSVHGVNGENLPASDNWLIVEGDTSRFKLPNLSNKGEYLRSKSSLYNHTIGAFVGDAMQPISGSFGAVTDGMNQSLITPPFSLLTNQVPAGGLNFVSTAKGRMNLDTSSVVRTAEETRGNGWVTQYWIVAKPSYAVTSPSPYNAINVLYNNVTSGLTSTNIQSAIDEVNDNLNNISSANIDYNNSNSGLIANNVQDAIDELVNIKIPSMNLTRSNQPNIILTSTYEKLSYNNVVNEGTAGYIEAYRAQPALPITGVRILKGGYYQARVKFNIEKTGAGTQGIYNAGLFINGVINGNTVQSEYLAEVNNGGIVTKSVFFDGRVNEGSNLVLEFVANYNQDGVATILDNTLTNTPAVQIIIKRLGD